MNLKLALVLLLTVINVGMLPGATSNGNIKTDIKCYRNSHCNFHCEKSYYCQGSKCVRKRCNCYNCPL
uniref:Potassium channel toxin alpha-KTx 6.16 n=1 Tax=Opisthacanthus cayaporum TaxID=573324 RepID=KAX6G_OPICY